MKNLLPSITVMWLMLLLGGCSDLGSQLDTPSAATKVPAAAQADPPKLESPSHEGHWAAVSATLAGAPFPSAITDSITLLVTGDKYEVNVAGRADKGTCTLDRAASPNRMTITSTEGPNAGKTFLAVIDFPDPNQLRVCYDLSGAAFPKAFESTADNGLFLVTYKRTY